ncbi:uncharacterized protein [Tiliqua scincoides]|uniref:uncharacterized protein n=1 Tax=Tiliqua scincoides TaxID=71010 RepID=UPI003462F262
MSHEMEKEAGGIPGCSRTRFYNTDQVFSVAWLNFCLQETLLPGKPWHECSVDLSKINSEKLEDARIWLQKRCFKAAEGTHCQFSFDAKAAEVAPEVARFLDDVYNIVTTEMELLLATCEAQHKEKGEQENKTFYQMTPPSLSWYPKRTSALLRRPKSIESEDIGLALGRKAPSQLNRNEEDFQLHIRPELHPPVLSCPESDLLGDLLCAIISQNSENMSTTCERLNGKLLPKTLRQFIWIDKLLRSGSKNGKIEKLIAIEREARENFGRTIAQRIAELKLRNATRSPISGLIENAVVKKYERVPCMCPFATNKQMILETSKTLNVLYVFNGTYEPYLIYWLFPLQIAFKQITPRAEHPYELAMYLHFLHWNLFPSWTKIFAMAESVMSLLEREDGEFFSHLQHAFRKNVTIEPKDFLVELILQERCSAQEMFAFENEFQRRQDFTKEFLASPVIFLRKWMGEGFVGILDLPAILLVWDQLFMQAWKSNLMEDFCFAVLLLLKDSFMAAEDYPAMRQVFLCHASCLLTADIQRAWIHLQRGGLPTDVPGLNRLNQRPLVDLSPRHGSAEARNMNLGFWEISPIGVKDILLKIVLPIPQDEQPHTETWVQNFDPSAVKLTVSVFCGSDMLRSKTSSLQLSFLQKSQAKTTRCSETEFTYHFNESFVFDCLDPTAFVDVMDAKPYLLLKVECSRNGKEPLTLGWQKVDAFQPKTEGFRMIWSPREFSTLVPLNSVEVFDRIMEYPFRLLPQEFAGGHSTIQLTVYDIVKEKCRLRNEQVKRERLTKFQELSFLYAPWVPHNPSFVLPKPPRVNQPFDLYIDALHYIPDNATITKVTGQFSNSELSHLHGIIAFPDLKSSARNPEFHYRAEISRGVSERMNSSTWLLLQIHTVDADSGHIILLGSCMIHVFNAEGELNVGGFQLKLRAGLSEDGPASLTPSSLNYCPFIPCCTLLIRLLPHAQVPVPTPDYLTGYYFTDGAKPNNSELKIISSFQKDNSYPKFVQDMAVQLINKEQSRVPPDQLETWCVEKLDERNLLPQHFPKCINLYHTVHYRLEAGLCVRIKQAFGLKADGFYVNVLTRILKGAASTQLPELPQSWGGEEKFLVQQLDFSSLQRSPRWTDPSVVLHPYLDDNSVLLVQIYGLDVIYTPDPSGQRPGTIVPRSGGVLELNAQSQLGWSTLPLFDRNYVRTGIHSAPLFQGAPNTEFLQGVMSRPVKDVMAEGLQKKRLKLLSTYGSIAVEVWDGHYFDYEHPELPVLNDLLMINKTRKFLATQTSKRGKDMSQLLMKTLDKKLRKLGRNSLEYGQQEHFYKQAMENAFYDVVVSEKK